MKKTNNTINIIFDWGGSIIRDYALFEYISFKSNNSITKWKSPKSWNSIRSLCNEDCFSKIENNFFEYYKDSINIINKYFKSNTCSKTKSFIIYDSNPVLKMSNNKIEFLFSKVVSSLGININGVFVHKDKLKIYKDLNIFIAVDDDPRVASYLASSGIKCILLLRKWNKDFNLEFIDFVLKNEHVERIKNNIFLAEDWVEVDYYINKIILEYNEI